MDQERVRGTLKGAFFLAYGRGVPVVPAGLERPAYPVSNSL